MPYFSFSLKQNFLQNTSLSNNIINKIQANKVYYSKNTYLWKELNKSINHKFVSFVKFEKRIKIQNIGNKIIFCLPPSIGLGDSIEYALAIRTIIESNRFKKISVAFIGRYKYIFKKYFNLNNLYCDFIEKKEIIKYDTIFHFTLEIYDLKFQKYIRSDIQKNILNYFNISIKKNKFKKEKNNIKKITLFPVSNSPIRSMSINITNKIIDYFINNFKIEIIFDSSSIISNFIEKNIILENYKKNHPKTLEELCKIIEKIDYGIFIDSGPLHLAKILQKKGILINTTVSNKILLNNDYNIKSFETYYKSSYCESPCGLTNIFNKNNKIGCYQSLKIEKKEIINLDNFNQLQRGNIKENYTKFLIKPVECIRNINIDGLVNFIKKDLD